MGDSYTFHRPHAQNLLTQGRVKMSHAWRYEGRTRRVSIHRWRPCRAWPIAQRILPDGPWAGPRLPSGVKARQAAQHRAVTDPHTEMQILPRPRLPQMQVWHVTSTEKSNTSIMHGHLTQQHAV